ncbi:hypothetical protein ECANGB1_707 [Enterospora canceri]|uniref:Sm domain-containing protein n=1 Tax=Enterospora canceri TaxID=1081671 RepID=A0A1Y1S7Q8_9MICR|nr:hypothetical protein ECANGB1_707 [Enterospora canceri]
MPVKKEKSEAENKNVDSRQKKILFHDLSLYLNKNVMVVLSSGETLLGKLTHFDEVANSIIENGKKKQFVLGKAITMICITK